MIEPKQAYYFCRVHPSQDNFVTEFCVVNPGDPDQFVETLSFEGGTTYQKWEKRFENNLLIFRSPDGYIGGAIGWCYDNSLQIGKHAPLEVLDRELLRNQKSLVVNGLRDL